ncbi:ADP-dependent (S)-NAD(P)H-hydrate dehydratase [uncultured archaeon]|nr:ADP-dependent (S)-NAD(P)H-hydrate dehydratase [uncultured archaeon]
MRAQTLKMSLRVARSMVPARDPRSRKGQNGRVLVVGGSKEYFGSPALAGLASLRTGADLCYIFAPRFCAPVVAGYSPDLIVWSYPEDYLSRRSVSVVEGLEKHVDALVIGNGLTKQAEVLNAVRSILSTWQKPVVVDADALVPGLSIASRQAVLAPHAVEFERIGGGRVASDLAGRVRQVTALSEKLRATVLLKGVEDIVSDGKRTFVNTTGNAGMTAGGTGDTLAGVCGALLSQRVRPLEAATLAAFVNGYAGDRAFNRLGYSLIASDIISELPASFKEIRGGE